MSLVVPILFFAAGVLFSLYPILPGALFAIGGMLIYGFLEGWSEFPVWFWYVQGFLVLLNFLTDWIANIFGIRRVGGSKEAIWGSAIGMVVMPIVMGPFGILVGPFIGAVIGEFLHVRQAGHVARVGIASLIGFFLGSMIKFVLVLIQILIFVLQIW